MKSLLIALLSLVTLSGSAQLFKTKYTYTHQTSFFLSYQTGKFDSTSVMTIEKTGEFILFGKKHIDMSVENGSVYHFDVDSVKHVGSNTEYYCTTGVAKLPCKITKHRMAGNRKLDFISMKQHYSNKLKEFTQTYIYLDYKRL